jgi:hypothetical protein
MSENDSSEDIDAFFNCDFRYHNENVSLEAFLNKRGQVSIFINEEHWIEVPPLKVPMLIEQLSESVGYVRDELSQPKKQKTDSPDSLSTKERNTLLVLIAALCKQAKFDWNAKGVSVSIAKATDEIGAPVTDDTIRNTLKQVDAAIASRSKLAELGKR